MLAADATTPRAAAAHHAIAGCYLARLFGEDAATEDSRRGPSAAGTPGPRFSDLRSVPANADLNQLLDDLIRTTSTGTNAAPSAGAGVAPVAARRRALEIIKLPAGELAPDECDCVRVIRKPDGGFELNCNALQADSSDGEVDSVSLIGGDTYRTFELAEAAGLAWAHDHSSERVYVCTLDPDDLND
ncbi:hypothetical protein ACT009_13350 [Sphingomonas sp. Tas61C01]|uniref:hypothetical protein n=1 Tax=Sphingomonas sp. Tas61C01 TaxID=3458297 RepID=UPI00403EBF17